MPYKDQKKKRENQRKNYSKNRKIIIKRVAERRRKIKKWFQEYRKDLKCSKCGENHPATLDFHHKKEKIRGINFLTHWGYSKETIKKEISKCQVLCANCHRKLHYHERTSNNNI